MKVSWTSYWWLVIFSKLLCVQLSHLPKCWLMREQQTTRQMKSAPSEKQTVSASTWSYFLIPLSGITQRGSTNEKIKAGMTTASLFTSRVQQTLAERQREKALYYFSLTLLSFIQSSFLSHRTRLTLLSWHRLCGNQEIERKKVIESKWPPVFPEVKRINGWLAQ